MSSERKPPYLVFEKIDGDQEKTLDGALESIVYAEFNLFLWTKSYFEGKELAQDVKTAFNKAPDKIGDIDIELIEVNDSSAEMDIDTELHSTALQLRVFYQN